MYYESMGYEVRIGKVFLLINISSITVMSDGLPSPNSTCDALFPGRTGHPKGILESPGTKSHLFQRLEGPLQCTKSLVPSDSQSLTLTVGGYHVGLVTYQLTQWSSGAIRDQEN